MKLVGGGGGGAFYLVLGYLGQVISVTDYSQDEASIRLPELHNASSNLDGPSQVSLHRMEHSFLQRLSSPFGPLSLVLKALQHDLGADDYHLAVVFLLESLGTTER